MNGVAKEFWNEIHDLRSPVPTTERPKRIRQRQVLVRRTVRRPAKRAA